MDELELLYPALESSDFTLLDTHFNRAWMGSRHLYLDNTAPRALRDVEYQGWLKCRLLHGRGYSVLCPDLILLDVKPLAWIQPLHFLAHQFAKDHGNVAGGLWVDISCGQTLFITFTNADLVHTYEDGAELYRSIIKGPQDLRRYVTGVAKWSADGRPLVMLFHHTSERAKASILQSAHFESSQWNIRGNKRLENIRYLYCTCLPRVDCDECLKTIAMATDGQIHLHLDPCPPPPLAAIPVDLSGHVAGITLDVYRESTANRTATIDLWIDPGHLAPPHLLRHFDGRTQVWYELVSAFIHRVGVDPDAILPLDVHTMELDYAGARHFNYAVLGDAWTPDGLVAPFDEEETTSIAKVESSGKHGTILDYWFAHANTDRFSNIDAPTVAFQERDQRHS